MRLLPLILTIAFSLSITACAEEKPVIAEDLNAQDFQEIKNEVNGLVIDVRTNQEVAGGLITGATHIDFYRNDFFDEIDKIDRNQPVFLYCAAGGRSSQVMKEMTSMGFKEVYNLIGGYKTWVKAGYSTRKPDWLKKK